TCNVGTAWLERRIQMRIDHHALFRPLTKATLALRADSLGATLEQALALAPAREFRAAPVEPGTAPDLSQEIAKSLGAALASARRPLLITGLGITRSRAAAALLGFIERQKIPFVTTLHAKGFLPENHRHWAGVIGRARRSDVKRFTARADLIIAVGYDPIEINYEEW